MIGESPYRVLRYSLPGALLPSENDFREFFQICRTETHTIGSQLPITSTQCFFVVVSGEVNITMGGKEGKQVSVSTVLPGDLILFFGVNIDAIIINGYMDFDGIKLGLHFRSSDALAQVIGADYMSVKAFLDQRPYLTSLRTLFELNMESFVNLPPFVSLTRNQVSSHSIYIFMLDNLTFNFSLVESTCLIVTDTIR